MGAKFKGAPKNSVNQDKYFNTLFFKLNIFQKVHGKQDIDILNRDNPTVLYIAILKPKIKKKYTLYAF